MKYRTSKNAGVNVEFWIAKIRTIWNYFYIIQDFGIIKSFWISKSELPCDMTSDQLWNLHHSSSLVNLFSLQEEALGLAGEAADLRRRRGKRMEKLGTHS